MTKHWLIYVVPHHHQVGILHITPVATFFETPQVVPSTETRIIHRMRTIDVELGYVAPSTSIFPLSCCQVISSII